MSLGPTLKQTYYPELPNYYQGKVRDNYVLADGSRLMITSDRQSAFDRVLAEIPYKGQVLSSTAVWWFAQTQDIVPNHLIEVVAPNAVLAKELTPIPIEVVVRGYLTGVTTTAAWYAYERGERLFCGNVLPEGMVKNQAFPEPILTPTTKAAYGGHDEKISAEEILEQGIVDPTRWQEIYDVALALFRRGQELAGQHGLILVDTKYEFGLDEKGVLHLMDEIHTPDSSRYWKKDTYEARFAAGEEPEYFDKEFLRLWLKSQGFMGDGELPTIPDELIERFSDLYITLYEMITGQTFVKSTVDPELILRNELKRRGLIKGNFVQLILGSASDQGHADKITAELDSAGVAYAVDVASAHKTPAKTLGIIQRLNEASSPVVYITIAGRSNALSGLVSANSVHPVIACPPFSDKADYLVNIHSSLQMPSETPAMTVIDPKNAAAAAVRMFGLGERGVREHIAADIKSRG